MSSLPSLWPLVRQRIAASWRLLAVLGFGVLVASTLLAVAPVYTRVMNDLGLTAALEQQVGSASRNGIIRFDLPLGTPSTAAERRALTGVLADETSWFTKYEVRYGAIGPLTLGRPGVALPTDRFRVLTNIYTYSDLDSHVRLTDGRLPAATTDPTKLEALVPAQAQRMAGVKLGDTVDAGFAFDDCNRPPPTQDPEEARQRARFPCVPQSFVELRAPVTIVGFIEKADADEPYWGAGAVFFGPPDPTDTAGPVIPLILPEQSFYQALPLLLPGLSSEYRVTSIADLTRIDSSNLTRAQASLSRLKARVEARGAVADTAMAGPLAEFHGRASFSQVPLLILLLQVIGIAVYYVILVSSLLSERRAVEVAMLRSRGASVWQVVLLSAVEAVLIGLFAAVIAPLLASGAVAALGKTGTFHTISGGGFLPFTIVPASFLYALGGAAIAALAVVIPAYFAARQGMVLFLRSASRPGKPFLQRYYIDLGVVGLAALGLWELNQRGSVFDARSVGGWSADPLLLASPLLLIVAVGALMFRFLPPLLSVLSRIVSLTMGPGLTLGFWQLTRSPARYTQLALLVVMAAAVGTFAATYGETTDRSQEQQALYAVGADMRLTGLGRLDRETSATISKSLEEIPNVSAAGAAYRTKLGLGPLPSFGEQFPVLAVDPEKAPSLLWYRDDFSSEPLAPLLRRISVSSSAGAGLPLPEGITSASIWAAPSQARPGTTLWLRTRDANNVFRLHEFGQLDFDGGYRQLTATFDPVRDGIKFPLTAVGLIMTQAAALNDNNSTVTLDDLTARDADGRTTILDDFEGPFRWDVVRTASRNRDAVQKGGRPHSGAGAAQFAFKTGTGTGVRGMIVSDPNIPLPALASQRFMDRTGLKPGGEVELVLGNVLVPLTVRGVVNLFPTMQEPETGFLIVNQDSLYYYASLTAQDAAHGPNEAWLKINSDDPVVRAGVVSQLHDRYGITSGQVIDSVSVLKSVRSDPVVRAGGSGILLLALVAAFSVLAVGFMLTLYLGGQGRSVEVSVMRSMGLSSRQMLTMISLEYLFIAVLGLIIGTIAGLQISSTMLSFLNVTEGGSEVVPPFSLATQWGTVAIAFVAAGAAFVLGVLGLVLYFLRLPVSRVLRLTR